MSRQRYGDLRQAAAVPIYRLGVRRIGIDGEKAAQRAGHCAAYPDQPQKT
jgi:hypothetical protein